MTRLHNGRVRRRTSRRERAAAELNLKLARSTGWHEREKTCLAQIGDLQYFNDRRVYRVGFAR